MLKFSVARSFFFFNRKTDVSDVEQIYLVGLHVCLVLWNGFPTASLRLYLQVGRM